MRSCFPKQDDAMQNVITTYTGPRRDFTTRLCTTQRLAKMLKLLMQNSHTIQKANNQGADQTVRMLFACNKIRTCF